MSLEKLKPKFIILGIDPWVFNENSGQSRWQSIKNEYAYGKQLTGNTSYSSKPSQSLDEPGRLSQLLNYSYTRAAATLLISRLIGHEFVELATTDEAPVRGILRRPDGSIVYDQDMEALSQEQVEKQAITYSNPPVYSLQNFKWSKPAASLLEDLLLYLSRHTSVVIFLPPYHPITYASISDKYFLREVEASIRTIATKHNTRIVGSFNPVLSNCIGSDFYDGMHPKNACMLKIFEDFRSAVKETP